MGKRDNIAKETIVSLMDFFISQAPLSVKGFEEQSTSKTHPN